MRKFIMNTTVLPNDGLYQMKTVSLEQAKRWVADGNFTSAVGHEGTAKVLSALLGVDVPVNRTQVKYEVTDEALCFKLLQRLPEGKVLSEEELKALPYELKAIKRLA